jgi:hypothetical protein
MTVPTVVMMPKKRKTARASAENEGNKLQYKRQKPRHLPVTNELLIDAGYTYPQQCIDELLEIAGDSSPQSRCDLLNALQLAQMAHEDEKDTSSRQRPRSNQINQLEKSIEKTCVLLRRIRRYDDFRNVGFVTQPVGRGVVDVATRQEMILGRVLELPRHPSISDQELILPRCDGMGAAINIEPLLRATLLAARRRRRRRGAANKVGKEAIVSYAADYFRKHSPKEPSTDPANPFHLFVQRFYEVVTKTKPSGFERQMRKIFRANRSGH